MSGDLGERVISGFFWSPLSVLMLRFSSLSMLRKAVLMPGMLLLPRRIDRSRVLCWKVVSLRLILYPLAFRLSSLGRFWKASGWMAAPLPLMYKDFRLGRSPICPMVLRTGLPSLLLSLR